jgi:hypothetical protein
MATSSTQRKTLHAYQIQNMQLKEKSGLQRLEFFEDIAQWQKYLQEMPKLIELDAKRVSCTELSWIVNIRQITILNLSENSIKEIPEAMYQLRQLTHLTLAYNGLTEIKNLPLNIQEVDFSHNKIEEIPDLSHYKITVLHLADNKITHLPRWMTKECPKELFSKKLDLTGNGITWISVTHPHFTQLFQEGKIVIEEIVENKEALKIWKGASTDEKPNPMIAAAVTIFALGAYFFAMPKEFRPPFLPFGLAALVLVVAGACLFGLKSYPKAQNFLPSFFKKS